MALGDPRFSCYAYIDSRPDVSKEWILPTSFGRFNDFQMSILDDLLSSLDVDASVRAVLVGAHWTVVCSRHCGLAATLITDHAQWKAQVRDVVRLPEKSARELAKLAHSTEPLGASIGVAAINSLVDVNESTAKEINASEVLTSLGWQKNVALIGRFHFIQQLRQSAEQLWVIEQHPTEDEYPAEAAIDLVPKADVVAITGSTLINHTLDGLLALCSPTATVMVLGPSTPLSAILFDHGVNIIFGACVVDEAAVLQTVERSASFRQVKGVRLLTFVRERGE